jgi:integrase/recombinase XerD
MIFIADVSFKSRFCPSPPGYLPISRGNSMVTKYQQSYFQSTIEGVRLFRDSIPHFVDREMSPYREINRYFADHARVWSSNSVRTAAENLSNFLAWMESMSLDISMVRSRQIEQYMNALVAQNRKCSGQSLATQTSSIKVLQMSTVTQRVNQACRFFSWVSKQTDFESLWDGDDSTTQVFNHRTRRHYQKSIAKEITGQFVKKSAQFLRLPDALSFVRGLASQQVSNSLDVGPRNQLMAKTMLQVGLRVHEVVSMPETWVSEIKIVPSFALQLGRVVGKGDKIRIIEWPNDLLLEIQEYCDFVRPLVVERARLADSKYIAPRELFLSHDGQKISTNWVEKIFQRNSKKTNINCKPHWLRHTFGTYHYLIHQDLAHLADLMGHSDQETTREYYVSTAELISKTGLFNDFQNQIDRDLVVKFE